MAQGPAKITILRANVSREQALAEFSSGGPAAWLRSVRSGPLQWLADIYLPFRLYRVEIDNSGRGDTRLLALDQLSGTLDPFAFDEPPAGETLEVIRTRNYIPGALKPEAANAQLEDKVRRMLFSTGFFRIRRLTIRALALDVDFYVPYWVALFGVGDNLQLRVMDAVRRRIEGAKVRDVIEEWMRGPTSFSPAGPDHLS